MTFEVLLNNQDDWTEKLTAIANEHKLHSLLVMQSHDELMQVVSANQQNVYSIGASGPKSTHSSGGCHELYCERIVVTGEPLYVENATVDPDWAGNEDLLKFGLGVYLGYPLMKNNIVVGTVCALNKEPIDFSAGNPSLKQKIEDLKQEIEGILAS